MYKDPNPPRRSDQTQYQAYMAFIDQWVASIEKENEEKPDVERDEPEVLGSEPIIGHRLFLRVYRHRITDEVPVGELRSLFRTHQTWMPGVTVESHCWAIATYGGKCCKFRTGFEQGKPSIPQKHCECGVWAVKTVDDLNNVRLPNRRIVGVNGLQYEIVRGQVELWGQAVEHLIGWRAQYGRVIPETIEPYTRSTYTSLLERELAYQRALQRKAEHQRMLDEAMRREHYRQRGIEEHRRLERIRQHEARFTRANRKALDDVIKDMLNSSRQKGVDFGNGPIT